MEEKETLPNLFYEIGINLMPKPAKDNKSKLRQISLMNIHSKVPKILEHQIQQHSIKAIHITKSDFSQE